MVLSMRVAGTLAIAAIVWLFVTDTFWRRGKHQVGVWSAPSDARVGQEMRARHASDCVRYGLIIGGVLVLVTGVRPERWLLQCFGGGLIGAAIIYAKWVLHGDLWGEKGGLTEAATAAAIGGTLAAVAALLKVVLPGESSA